MGLLDQQPPQGGLLGGALANREAWNQSGNSLPGGLLSQYVDWQRNRDHAAELSRLFSDPMTALNFAGVTRGPYQAAPNSLMGFRGNGENVGFNESNFPHTQYVRVTLDNGQSFVDAIRGMNQPHAIERAYRNWNAKDIEPITQTEAVKLDPALGR